MVLVLSITSFISGKLLVLQTALNTQLASALATPDALKPSLVSFSVGTALLVMACIIVVLTKVDCVSALMRFENTQWWMYAPGPTGVILVTCKSKIYCMGSAKCNFAAKPAPYLGVELWQGRRSF